LATDPEFAPAKIQYCLSSPLRGIITIQTGQVHQTEPPTKRQSNLRLRLSQKNAERSDPIPNAPHAQTRRATPPTIELATHIFRLGMKLSPHAKSAINNRIERPPPHDCYMGV
jgi:hypothetical protein